MDFNSLGLLLLRLGFGASMAVHHGFPKLIGFSHKMHTFPDPIGLGSSISLSLAVGAELLCALAVVIGIFTRLVCIPLIITMAVAFFVVHHGDPFGKKELSFLFLMAFSAIAATGPGAYSADHIFRRVR